MRAFSRAWHIGRGTDPEHGGEVGTRANVRKRHRGENRSISPRDGRNPERHVHAIWCRKVTILISFMRVLVQQSPLKTVILDVLV